MQAHLATMSTAPPPSIFSGKAWQQVLSRDACADGQFVYAVKSTGIYCRPSCPSRRPDRKNVRFFPGPSAAEAAGFRACLRCEPQRTAAKADPQAQAIAWATELLRDRAGDRTTLDDLAKASGLGKFAVQRGFKRVLGVTPGEFARAQRREQFRKELRPGSKARSSITEAAYAAGFGSSSRLYEGVETTMGMTPTAMRAGGEGERIRYTLAGCPLGRVLVAATEVGICSVLFGDSDEAAEAELQHRFPKADLQRDDRGMGGAVDAVLSQMTENPSAAALPLHVRATAFQQRVWKALTEIPRGETRTYGQIAASIGAPKAARAVGAACGANKLGVLIPCHRAVGADGGLTGFYWGVERKKKLLEMEGVERSGSTSADAAGLAAKGQRSRSRPSAV